VAGDRPQEVIFPFAVPVTEPSAAMVPDSVPDPVAPAYTGKTTLKSGTGDYAVSASACGRFAGCEAPCG
jgi:hypothetical protein